ncbi:BTAD domain-containing putative transcriptional regulator [Asanoa sp. WMMD1127]|uniref:AfsR/SARP family transcriptional regulator n=1 Tax=Asanoa sp. WMMD1127 TaxID=3016107 RepID=UPI002416C4E1|nr:BTAD domain-containing putative transcriptional regulator [Asanoa sp. WMMD1127]MDG4825045.1 BTAD domain-containing putative transcriptional regulator [Asanoa sp. WMMD1127]
MRLWAGSTDIAGRWVKPRIVLAVLAVNLNQPVTVEDLVDAVWDERPPRTARNSLQWLVSTLRRGLRDASREPAGPMLATTPTGYRLSGCSDHVDLCRFRELMTIARSRGDDHVAVDYARQALALWRGTALADVGGTWAQRTRQELRRERVSALATLFDLELRVGRHRAVVDELWAAAEREPLSEVLAAQLLIALSRCGRDAEALERYAQVRERIIDTVGAEPGHLLRGLHAQILRGQLR